MDEWTEIASTITAAEIREQVHKCSPFIKIHLYSGMYSSVGSIMPLIKEVNWHIYFLILTLTLWVWPYELLFRA